MKQTDFERMIGLLTEAVSRLAAGVGNEIGTAEVQNINRILAEVRGLAESIEEAPHEAE